MCTLIRPATVIVHHSAAGRALGRVLRTLCVPAPVMITARQEEPNPAAISAAVQSDSTPVVLIDVGLKVNDSVTSGLFTLRPSVAVSLALQGLQAAHPLREEELWQALIEFFKARDEIGRHLHDRINDLTSGRASTDPDRFRNDLSKLQDYLHRFDFHDEAAMLGEDSIETLSDSLARIQSRVFAIKPKQVDDEKLPNEPPLGYGTILVADDDGYPAGCVDFLKGKGYAIRVEKDLIEVQQLLEYDPSAVFLCDMTWHGDGLAGRRLMAQARRHEGCLVIALSGSLLEMEEAPEAHEICDGAEAKTEKGASCVHRLIWKWTNQQRQTA